MLSAVLVVGPSMVPTLRHGDMVLVRRGARIRPGDVVLARFPDGSPDVADRLVVKRAVRSVGGDGWWLEGDNGHASDDSRTYGPGAVSGRVVARYWPKPRLIRRQIR